MAGTPRFKVYIHGKYVAACKHPEDAAAIVAAYSSGEIRDGHKTVVYTDGVDGNAGESYDSVAEIVLRRVEEAHT